MTDEEILEEQNAYYMAGYPSRRSENKMDKEELEKDYYADRLEWHDLRKDPNDLPKRVCYVLNQAGTVTAYQPDRGFLGLGGIRVIAWCEIPTFTDKE